MKKQKIFYLYYIVFTLYIFHCIFRSLFFFFFLKRCYTLHNEPSIWKHCITKSLLIIINFTNASKKIYFLLVASVLILFIDYDIFYLYIFFFSSFLFINILQYKLQCWKTILETIKHYRIKITLHLIFFNSNYSSIYFSLYQGNSVYIWQHLYWYDNGITNYISVNILLLYYIKLHSKIYYHIKPLIK